MWLDVIVRLIALLCIPFVYKMLVYSIHGCQKRKDFQIYTNRFVVGINTRWEYPYLRGNFSIQHCHTLEGTYWSVSCAIKFSYVPFTACYIFLEHIQEHKTAK